MEFVIDPQSQYDERSHAFQEESTGKKNFSITFLLYFSGYRSVSTKEENRNKKT